MSTIYAAPFLCLLLSLISPAATAKSSKPHDPAFDPLHTFFLMENIQESEWPMPKYLDIGLIPKPEAFLLSQPLMTLGLATYYQRTPKLRTLLELDDDLTGNYYRAVLLVVDNDASRDDGLLADKNGESSVVELGLISINLPALPQKMIEGIRQAETPFGALLVEHQIITHSTNTHYFEIPCDKPLATHLHCDPKTRLFGRVNTLIRDDNNEWVAKVVEILTSAPTKQ